MSLKRRRSTSLDCDVPIFKSSAIVDRSSRFIAFYSPSVSAKEIQAQGEIETATHRIAAWRKPSSQRALGPQRLMETGHDDDGEKYGGKTLETVLTSMDVEGALVVARWWGGVMLGPVRFDHMRSCAREAISTWIQERETATKKQKSHEDAETKDRLVRTLAERDQSITVLRGLLAEKTQPSSSAGSAKGTTTKNPDYETLPLSTLSKLEQVRDATIGWILKGIEKAELAEASSHTKDPLISVVSSVTSETEISSRKDFGEDAANETPFQVSDQPITTGERTPVRAPESNSEPD